MGHLKSPNAKLIQRFPKQLDLGWAGSPKAAPLLNTVSHHFLWQLQHALGRDEILERVTLVTLQPSMGLLSPVRQGPQEP
eukprot:2548374-Pyramimonas_sp.AAC.1